MKNIIQTISKLLRKTEVKKEFHGDLAYLNDIPKVEVIDTIELEKLIGRTITNIKHDFAFNKIGGWLDYSNSYYELDNSFYVCFPYSGGWAVTIAKPTKNAKKIKTEFLKSIIGQQVENIYFEFFENEPEYSEPLYIELSNGVVLSETTLAPHGTGGANLVMYTNEEFKERVNDPEVDIRSIKTLQRPETVGGCN